MNVGDEATRSLWMATRVAPDAPQLAGDESADAVVVGSGIAGLSTAYELAMQGREVIVIDRGEIGKGMTARTTAHLTPFPDDSTKAMIDRRGLEETRHFYESQALAIDRIEEIVAAEKIDCNFRRLSGYLFPGPTTEEAEIDEELSANRKAGVPIADGRGLPFKGMDKTRCLEFLNQGTFHPLQYLAGLAQAIRRRGGRLYANTAATTYEEDADGVVIATEGGPRLRGRCAIFATNSPITNRRSSTASRRPIAPMRSPSRSSAG